jgi:DNA polymerase-3 subunit epsilon/ATP-dependent DNA helicase DinG
VQELFNDLHAVLEGRNPHGLSEQFNLRVSSGLRREFAWEQAERGWAALRDVWTELIREITPLVGDVGELPSSHEDAERRPGARAALELAADLESFVRFAEDAVGVGDRVMGRPSRDEVCWLSLHQGNTLAIHLAPLHVGRLLWDELFSRKESVVVTSATLTTESSFRYIRERLGLEDARELQVGSPFDFRRSTLLYLPTDLPEPGQPYYQHHLVDAIVDVVVELGGRTLVLFTSHGQLRHTYEALRQPMEAQRIILLGQGIDGSRARLLETFRTGPRAVLLGTSSFWEGVDVVGDALSCLVITRLPFTVPTDPVFAARSELFDDPFREYAVPQAILRFKQGFGRLIRSRTDRGVVVVLDRRIQTKRYGQAFLASLPDCTVRSGPARRLPDLARQWVGRR